MKKTFFCIDAHTCGNPVRVVAGGAPSLKGNTMMERRQHFLEQYDWIRTGLMFEPRGHDLMSGSILYPPIDSANDAGLLFIETSGCLPMCGHGLIGTVTVAIEEGLIQPKNPGTLRLETPAGIVNANYEVVHNKVRSVRFTNVPSFLLQEQIEVECPELGLLKVDVAYGGNFYGIIDSQENFPGIEKFKAIELIALSPIVRQRLNESSRFIHPTEPDIQGLTHVLWTGKPIDPKAHARNAVFYGDRAIDRSPCGTGTSARMAQWASRNLLQPGDEFIHESYIGSQFIGGFNEVTSVGNIPAIIPTIQGWAKVFGYNQISIDTEDDPFAYGFQVI